MKYKIGDELGLKEELGTFLIDSSTGTVYIGIDEDDDVHLHTDKTLEKDGYKLKEKVAPKKGVAVVVTASDGVEKLRASAGSFDERGWLECYCDGKIKGTTLANQTWRLYK